MATELVPGVVAERTALFFRASGMLVLADIHLGFVAARRARGMLLPEVQLARLEEELSHLFQTFPVRSVLFLGDVKHEFGLIHQEEWRGVEQLLDFLQRSGKEVLFIEGNHDRLLAPLLARRGYNLQRRISVNVGNQNLLFVHGHQEVEECCDLLVMGHEHPALCLSDGLRSEMVKSFLVGRDGERTVIVVPSWNPLAIGVNVLEERPLGPLLKSFTSFSAFAVIEHQVLAFGRVETLRRLMSVRR